MVRTLPIKFQLFFADGSSASGAHATLAVYQLSIDEVVGDPIEVSSTSAADSGNVFSYSGYKYIYNLDTGSASEGEYRLVVSSDDATTQSIDNAFKCYRAGL